MPAGEQKQELVVRAHSRRACDLAAKAVVAGEDASRVHLTGSATGTDGALACRVVDVSAGGVGLSTACFMPANCTLRVSVDCDGGSTISVEGVVKRVQMTSAEPRYYLGLAFAGAPGASLDALMDLIDGSGDGREATRGDGDGSRGAVA